MRVAMDPELCSEQPMSNRSTTRSNRGSNEREGQLRHEGATKVESWCNTTTTATTSGNSSMNLEKRQRMQEHPERWGILGLRLT